MEKGKLARVWADHVQDNLQRAEEEQERRSREQQRMRRVKEAGELATSITDAVGYERKRPQSEAYDARITSPLPLGQLEVAEDDKTHAFAQVFVYYERDCITHEKKSRFGITHVTFESVKSHRVHEVGIHYFAGDANGENLEQFATSRWSAGVKDEDAIAAVEQGLADISERYLD